jgi:hypothetical protein
MKYFLRRHTYMGVIQFPAVIESAALELYNVQSVGKLAV